MTSNKDNWTTPIDYWDRLNAKYDFGLDAAADASNALCSKHYSIENSAFDNDWVADSHGHWIWMNPPYGRQIKAFMAKAHEQVQRGAKVVALVPARTDTFWWHEYAMPYKIEFIRGRLKFGNAKQGAPFPSALVIMER